MALVRSLTATLKDGSTLPITQHDFIDMRNKTGLIELDFDPDDEKVTRVIVEEVTKVVGVVQDNPNPPGKVGEFFITTDLQAGVWHRTGIPRPPQSDNTVIYTVSFDARDTRLPAAQRVVTSTDKQGRLLRQLVNKAGQLGTLGSSNFTMRLPGNRIMFLARDGNEIVVASDAEVNKPSVLLTGAILTIKKKAT